jgi:hypothetical protein
MERVGSFGAATITLLKAASGLQGNCRGFAHIMPPHRKRVDN